MRILALHIHIYYTESTEETVSRKITGESSVSAKVALEQGRISECNDSERVRRLDYRQTR